MVPLSMSVAVVRMFSSHTSYSTLQRRFTLSALGIVPTAVCRLLNLKALSQVVFIYRRMSCASVSYPKHASTQVLVKK